MPNATRRACTSLVQPPEPVQFSGQSDYDRFSATIIHLPAKTVARLANVSTDTVNSWRTGRRFPQHKHLKRLQQHIPAVRRFIAQEFGFSEPRGIVADLQQLANDSTPDAAEAKALLRSILRD